MLSILVIIMILFYLSDLRVYFGLDHNKDDEIFKKELEEAKSAIISNSPILYTLVLPFLFYSLSQGSQVSIPITSNIPEFTGFSLTIYMILHSFTIIVKTWYENTRDFHVSYSKINTTLLLVLLISLCLLTRFSMLPAKIVAVTYLFLLLRHIEALTVYYMVIERRHRQTRRVVYVP